MTRLAGALAALVALAAAGCGGGSRRDVVIVTLDTYRADRLGCYGNASGLTPHLDAEAAHGATFLDASAAAPITLPSHASLFTGLSPTATGVRNNGTFVVPRSETTLAEILRDAGWSTGAVVAAYPLARRFGLDQGFEVYDDDLPQPPPATDGAMPIFFAERDARAVTDRALEVWRRLARRPRFLWVHYFDAHAPYAPPDPYRSRHSASPYDGEVAYVDAEAGRLLEALAADSPGAIVVVAGDHGESLGEHGEKTHGVFVYQSTIRVPLILSARGLVPEGARVTVPVSLVDVLPTVLALAGVPAPRGIHGADLAPTLRGGRPPSRTVYAESYLPRLQFRFSELTMVRRGPLKWIDAPSPELFDVVADPSERANLAGGHPDEAALREALAGVQEGADPDAARRAAGALDAESEARLRSLGYTSAGLAASRPGEGRGRDPKSMVDYLQRYDRGVGLISQGRYAEGISLLRELIPQAPENFMARYQLAAGLLSAGDVDAAAKELASVVAAAPDFANAHLMAAEVESRRGHIDEAIRDYEAAAAAEPALAEPALALGRFLESVGRFEPAGRAYLEALNREPGDPETSRTLLALRASRGEVERGIAELREVLARRPDAAGAWAVLANTLRRRGDLQGAAEAYRKAVAIDPSVAEAGAGSKPASPP